MLEVTVIRHEIGIRERICGRMRNEARAAMIALQPRELRPANGSCEKRLSDDG
jgi:hypothetical protein